MEEAQEIVDLTVKLAEEMADAGMDTELPPRPYVKSKDAFMEEQIAAAEEEANEQENDENA